jgi:hypothetical protein
MARAAPRDDPVSRRSDALRERSLLQISRDVDGGVSMSRSALCCGRVRTRCGLVAVCCRLRRCRRSRVGVAKRLAAEQK